MGKKVGSNLFGVGWDQLHPVLPRIVFQVFVKAQGNSTFGDPEAGSPAQQILLVFL